MGKGAGSAPVSAHPAFPAIVALWFAALLGLGSLILPVVLLERLTVTTGIASLVPSAAPPLGFSTRATLALAAAVIGALMGITLARKVAQSHALRPSERFGDEEPARRPISAHDELGEEGLGKSDEGGFGKARPRTPVVQKRRALAIADEGTRSEYLLSVSLPGHGGHDDDSADAPDDDALELGDFAGPGDEAGEQDFAMTGGSFDEPEDIFDEEEVDFAAPGERQEFRPAAPAAAGTPAVADPLAGFDDEPDAEEEEVEAADALPFSAPSLRRKAPVLELSTEEDDHVEDDMPDFSMLQRREFAPEPAAAPVPQTFEAAPKLSVVEPLAAALDPGVDDRSLDDLGLVQLAARLGASLERRRAQRVPQGYAVPAPCPIFTEKTEDFCAAAADEAALARADFFGGKKTAHHDNFDEPEFGPEPTTNPFAARATMQRALAAPEREPEPEPEPEPSRLSSFRYDDEARSEDDEDGSDSEEEYSSLLEMKNPFQRQQPEFVRIEEPELGDGDFEATVTFPARKPVAEAEEAPAGEAARPFDPPPGVKPKGAPRNHDDAERELRAALETLQRMSGAA
ncbi:hypothetical protein [Croceibacterium salegens]|nr:hypothetical protein [Croceibacterium salegens]